MIEMTIKKQCPSCNNHELDKLHSKDSKKYVKTNLYVCNKCGAVFEKKEKLIHLKRVLT